MARMYALPGEINVPSVELDLPPVMPDTFGGQRIRSRIKTDRFASFRSLTVWGASCPYPMEMGDEGPIVDLPIVMVRR